MLPAADPPRRRESGVRRPSWRFAYAPQDDSVPGAGRTGCGSPISPTSRHRLPERIVECRGLRLAITSAFHVGPSSSTRPSRAPVEDRVGGLGSVTGAPELDEAVTEEVPRCWPARRCVLRALDRGGRSDEAVAHKTASSRASRVGTSWCRRCRASGQVPTAGSGSRQTRAVPSTTTSPCWLTIVVRSLLMGLSSRCSSTSTSAVMVSPGRTGAR